MGVIYKITNLINGNAYIGQTSRPLKERWKEHRTGNYFRQTIDTAIKKYGQENFTIQTLEECPDEKLNEREQYWIAYYNTYKNGYNNTKGGQIYESTRLKEKEIERIITEWKNTDLCLTHFHKYIGHSIETVKNYLLQNGVSQEEINARKYNQTIPKRKINTKKDAVVKKSKLEKEQERLQQEQDILNDFSEGHNLTFLIKKYHKTSKTIKEILIKNNISLEMIENQKFKDRTANQWKKIYCYDLTGKLLKEYPTRESLLMDYTLKELKLIHNCCCGLKKTSLNKKWSYTPLAFSEEDIKLKEKKCDKYDINNILVESYDSMSECHKSNNISYYAIRNSNQTNKYYNGYRYKIN